MIYNYAIVALIAASIAGVGTWRVEEWRWTAKEVKREQQVLADQQRIAKETFRKSEKVIAAQNASAARMVSLNRAAASSRDALGSLQYTSEVQRRAAADSLSTCTANAATVDLVFGKCGVALQRVAADADLWASTAVMLHDACFK